MMTITTVIFSVIVIIAAALAVSGAMRDSYHAPAVAALVAAFNALGIILVAVLIFFWNWEKPPDETIPVTGLIIANEMTLDRDALTRSISDLEKNISLRGGRSVLITYNSTGASELAGLDVWQSFNRFEQALPAMQWLKDRHGSIPVAVLSDEYPAEPSSRMSKSWDVSWIDPSEDTNKIEEVTVTFPRRVFVGQEFTIKAEFPARSQTDRAVLSINNKVVQETPISLEGGKKFSKDLKITLDKQGFSIVSVTFFKGEDQMAAARRFSVLGLAKPRIIYLSTFGKTAPLSKVLVQNEFEIVHIPPDQVLLNAQSWRSALVGPGDLIIMDSIPDLYLQQSMTARLVDTVRRLGASLLYIPGSNVSVDMQENPLEGLLPVNFGYPEGQDKMDDLAFVAIVDASMSMFYTAKGASAHGAFKRDPDKPASKILMAKKALDNLSTAIGEEDHFGILTVTDSPSWVLKPGTKRDLATESELIRKIYAMGPGINLYSGLLAAYNELITLESEIKHVLIFLDTADVDEYQVADRGTVWDLLESFRDNNITVSLIGFGNADDPHIPDLNRFAEESGGYLYLTTELDEIPGFGLKDLDQVTENLVVYQTREVDFFSTDFTGTDTFPDIKGQVVTTLKPGASLFVWTDRQLPLYAAWPFGKGTVGIFSADSGLSLAGDWSTLEGNNPWLTILTKLMESANPQHDLFYSREKDGHWLYVETGSTLESNTLEAQALYSRGYTVSRKLEKVGQKNFAARIDDLGKGEFTINLTDRQNREFQSRILRMEDRSAKGGPKLSGNFVPRPAPDRQRQASPYDLEILRLLILAAVLLLVIGELFRPPGVED